MRHRRSELPAELTPFGRSLGTGKAGRTRSGTAPVSSRAVDGELSQDTGDRPVGATFEDLAAYLQRPEPGGYPIE
jgi:hypothetical protein